MVIHTKIQKVKPKDVKEPLTPIYYINFEDYLKPTNFPKKSKPLLFTDKQNRKPELRLKLLEHPVLVAGRKSRWRLFKERLHKFFQQHKKAKRQAFVKTVTPKSQPNTPASANENPQKVKHFVQKWHNKTFSSPKNERLSSIKLPKFLSFLRARNDDGLCKRKSGFEIYCEMASIHGFINFVGSTTGQRAFWCFVICVAMASSGFILLLSHLISADSPTILYTESTQHPTFFIPFPSITICNLNLLSKSKVTTLAGRL